MGQSLEHLNACMFEGNSTMRLESSYGLLLCTCVITSLHFIHVDEDYFPLCHDVGFLACHLHLDNFLAYLRGTRANN